MAKEFRFPDVGEGITEGELVRWLVKEGEEIQEDQVIAEVETDKAVVELPSPYAGVILKRNFKEKDIVRVGEALVVIGEKGEALEEEPGEKKEEKAEEARPAGIVGQIIESRQEIREVLATPKVRRLALELGVDLSQVRGSGPEGRITEEDISRAPARKKPAVEARRPVPKIKSKFDFYGEVERLPLRGVRRATAKKMSESTAKAAHVTHFDEADVTELARVREELRPKAQKKNIKLTYLPIIVKAAIAALKLHPLLNATLDDEEEEIIIKKYYNIGIAVDVPDGLIVPVVKLANIKSLFELAAEIQQLAWAAKARTLDLADLKGGTFSITNVGMLGGEFATPIINYPEVAILATLRIADRVRVKDGKIAIRKTLPLCLSFDHRVIDGAEAARFINDLVKHLEKPSLLTLEL